MTQIRWMTAKIKSFDSYVLLSNIKTHLPLKCFLCRNKDKKRKTFLVFTDNNLKRSKTSKNASKRASESAQLEKNNFSTEKKYFSNREIKFSQLAVSDFPAGFTSNCFFVKFFLYWQLCGKGVFGVAY